MECNMHNMIILYYLQFLDMILAQEESADDHRHVDSEEYSIWVDRHISVGEWGTEAIYEGEGHS